MSGIKDTLILVVLMFQNGNRIIDWGWWRKIRRNKRKEEQKDARRWGGEHKGAKLAKKIKQVCQDM